MSGTDSALVVAALFALALWEFETDVAQQLLSDKDTTSARSVYDSVSARWRALLTAAGLWGTGSTWTPELIAKRANVRPALALTEAELPISILALDAIEKEFSDDWNEFCTVIPGAIQWYPLGPPDVPRLARHLETVLAQWRSDS